MAAGCDGERWGALSLEHVLLQDRDDLFRRVDDAGLIGNVGAGVGSMEVGALELGVTYYWRVDSMNDDGSLQSMGNVWSFTTSPGNVVVETRTLIDDEDDVEERLDRDNALDRGSSDLEMPYEDTGRVTPRS